MKKGFLAGLLSFLSVIGVQGAIAVSHNAIQNPELFGLRLGEGQELYGRVEAVNSVSLQRYLTPAYSVVEMVVDLVESPLQIRIYSTTPLDPVAVGATLAEPIAEGIPAGLTMLDSVESGSSQMVSPIQDGVVGITEQIPVIKNYPLTTHSKTIEYALPSPSDVQSLFRVFSGLWLREPDAIQEMEDSDTEDNPQENRISPLSRAVFSLTGL